MFLQLCFLLLPATALSLCNNQVAWLFFNAVDLSGDDFVGKAETALFILLVDVNLDSEVTLAEAQERVPDFVPTLAGREQELINLFDYNTDGVVSNSDIDAIYEQFDANKDGLCSTDEYQQFLKAACSAG